MLSPDSSVTYFMFSIHLSPIYQLSLVYQLLYIEILRMAGDTDNEQFGVVKLYSGTRRFETQFDHRLSWLKICVILIFLVGQMSGEYYNVGSDHFLRHFYRFNSYD
jgi:hypothetical protein